jgi:hypothetical protein
MPSASANAKMDRTRVLDLDMNHQSESGSMERQRTAASIPGGRDATRPGMLWRRRSTTPPRRMGRGGSANRPVDIRPLRQ